MGRANIFLSVLLLAGCANPPRFVKTTRVLRLLYRPATMPYLDNPRFSFELPVKWRGPEAVPGGVKFREPKDRASISIAFLAKGERGWREPEVFRQYMRERGTVEDSHILYHLEVSSRQADGARFTEYLYGQEYLLGQKVELLESEILLAPDPWGNFIVQYETRQKDFPRFHRVFERFLHSLVLADPKTLEKLQGGEQ